MSTKAQIQALIDTKLANTSDITASELREVENAQLNENFNAQVIESGDLGGFLYTFKFTKKGNYCLLNGEITNSSGFIGGSEFSFPIVNNFATPLSNVRFVANNSISGSPTNMLITSDSDISISGNIASNVTIYFNLTYTINS